jgi:predicted permease
MYSPLRSLARTPGFTAIAVVTLALGIGMNTAMFSMLNGFLLRPLSYPHADRLFVLERNSPQQPHDEVAAVDVEEIMPAVQEVAELAMSRYWSFTVTDPEHAPDVPLAMRVSSNYFRVLGLLPTEGRTFRPEEDAPGRNNVVILSHRYWQTRFGGAPGVIGRTLKLDGVPAEIVGILPPDPNMPRIAGPVALFRPLALTNEERANRSSERIAVLGRYRDGATPAQALAQFAALGERLAREHPLEDAGMSLGVRSLQSTTLSGTGLSMTLVLIGLAAFVLLIACANLANLLLARAIARAREFSIRAALGASRWHLIRPLAAECITLALLGTGSAFLVSTWTTHWLAARFGELDQIVDFSPDTRVLGFTLLIALATTVLFGVGPAWWASRVKINDTLKSGARGSTGTRTQTRFRQTLIVLQFALALILLAGAGLFLEGLKRLVGDKVGWDPAHVMSGVVNLSSPTRYGSAAPILAFHSQLRDKLLALPGVQNASVSYDVPLFDPPSRRNYLVAGRPAPATGQELAAWVNGVSASFLDTMGMHLLRGRFIDETDQLKSHPVVVINETMARALFPDTNPIGQQIAEVGDKPNWAEVVGVVADVRAMNMRPSPIRFQVYKPFTQEAWGYVTIAVRLTDPAQASALLEPMRKAVASLDSDMPVVRLMPLPQRIQQNFAIWRTIDQLLVLFAALGLFLAALGIYGVIARLVTQRTSEIGIRIALGAQLRDIALLVLGSGVRLTVAGAVIGAIGAYFLSRAIGNALPAFRVQDPVPIAAATAILAIVALLACWLPARRATKVNPVEALRAD